MLVQEVQPAVAALHIRTSNDDSVYSDDEEDEEEEGVVSNWLEVDLSVVYLVGGEK